MAKISKKVVSSCGEFEGRDNSGVARWRQRRAFLEGCYPQLIAATVPLIARTTPTIDQRFQRQCAFLAAPAPR